MQAAPQQPHTVAIARQAALDYIRSGELPGVLGAYCIGSAALLPLDAALSAHSDFDVMAVLAPGDARPKPGKLLRGGVLLEISVISMDALRDPARAAEDYHIANGLSDPACVLYDPHAVIAPLCQYIARDFSAPDSISRRVRNARDKAERMLLAFDPAAPSPERLNGWLFPAGVLAQAILVAALQNPTVRTRYAAARRVLLRFDLAAEYERLLALSGFESITPAQARTHLSALASAFDDASRVLRTPFFFASDLTPLARPLAIDGSRALIESGLHREAMFWIAATFARCEMAFMADAPALLKKHLSGIQALRSDLGVPAPAGEAARARNILRFLPALDAITEAIIARPDRLL